MERALAIQDFPDDLKQYMLEQLFVPADRIREVVAERKKSPSEALRIIPTAKSPESAPKSESEEVT